MPEWNCTDGKEMVATRGPPRVATLTIHPFPNFKHGREMTEIVLGEGDSVDWALRVFRRKIQRSGILRDLRKGRFYTKPSLAKRLKLAAAKRRRRRNHRNS